MEILNKIKTFSILLIVGILVWGCSSEPDELYFDSPQDDTEFWDENNSSGNQSEVDIKLLVEECVNVNVRYSDYIWYFDIESTLHHKLPNRKIEFGIGHGEINGIEQNSIENEA